MVYTNIRRKKMNKALRALYPDIEFHEPTASVPVMQCTTLPAGAVLIESMDALTDKVQKYCTRENEIGLHLPDYSKALPVFILSNELQDGRLHHFYRVNYVSPTEGSQRMAEKYIAKGLLYAVV